MLLESIKNVCSAQEMAHWVVVRKSNTEVEKGGGKVTVIDLHDFEIVFNADALSYSTLHRFYDLK